MLISVTLKFAGARLDPAEITRILGVLPHNSWHEGETRFSTTQKKLVRKFGVWEWTIEDKSERDDINGHLKKLNQKFQHAYALLGSLPKVENAWIDVCIVGDENTSCTSFVLDRESTMILNMIALPIEFSTYQLLPDQTLQEHSDVEVNFASIDRG